MKPVDLCDNSNSSTNYIALGKSLCFSKLLHFWHVKMGMHYRHKACDSTLATIKCYINDNVKLKLL